MKTNTFLALGCVALMSVFGCNSAQTSGEVKKEISMENEVDKVSYALGVNVATGVKGQGCDSLNADAISQAIKDVYSGGAKMTPEEANQSLNEFFGKLKQKASAGVIKAGQDFLAANKTKEGVIETESGLQYKILTAGTGPVPTLNDKVKTHYHGTLINGDVFDSSVDRGEPISFPVSGVIAGWTEALQLMPVGSKWELYVPSNLAYGERGAGPKIGPHTTLIFTVELLGIE